MLEQMASVRTQIIKIYKRHETPINYALKFIMGLVVFMSINHFFSNLGTPYATKISRLSIVLLAALITAIAPPTWVFVLMWLFVTFHIFFFSLELSIFAGLLLLCVILFYIRIFPKESFLIVLLLLCFKLKISYFVPLFAGLFAGIGAVGALILGTLLWHSISYIEIFIDAGSTLKGIEVLSLPQTFASNYRILVEMLAEGEWIYTAVIFVVVALITHIISKLPINYSMEIAIAAGAIVLLSGMIVGKIMDAISNNVIGIVLSVIISTILIYICKFFYIVVDYNKTEQVTFQDDNYVYYVKAVPKLSVESKEE